MSCLSLVYWHPLVTTEGCFCVIIMGEMSKQTLWVKKRTSRGGGRVVSHRERRSLHNINRDVHKNQLVYSHYLLKFVVIFALGLLWVRLGVAVGPFTALPIGLIVGLAIIAMERLREWRNIELLLLILACSLSYLFPVGLVL